MKLITLKVKSSSSDFYTIIIEITDTIKVSCNCGAGIFGKLCKHKIAVLSGDRDIILDKNDESILEEINSVISKSDFFNLNNELESAKKAVEIAKKQETKAKNKLETAIKNGIKINS